MKLNEPYLQKIEFQNGELNFKNFLSLLWSIKFWIGSFAFIGGLLAGIYLHNAQQWWVSRGKIIPPQIVDFAEYYRTGSSLRQVIDWKSENNSDQRSKIVDRLIDRDMIFKNYIFSFDSLVNKTAYLKASSIFEAYLTRKGIRDPDKISSELRRWADFIKVNQANREINPETYEISLMADSNINSFQMLKEYSDYILNLAQKDAVANLLALKTVTQQELEYEVKALSSVKNRISEKNSEHLRQRIQRTEANLNLIERINVDVNVKIQSVRFIEPIDIPVQKDTPKGGLIFVFSLFLGASVGLIAGFVRLSA